MKTFLRISLIFVTAIVQKPLVAQGVPVGLDSVLNNTLDSMRNVLGAISLSAAMQLPDESVWANASGISSVSPLKNVTEDHAFLIGSVTKTLTAACILQLDDEGILSIDDSLYQWLDTMPHINPNITIRHLLQHTSGIHDVLSTPCQQDSLLANIYKIWTPEELIEKFIRPPLFQAGTSWSYSNTNYMLLGMIIKEATGNSFYAELRNRFFTPLGLSSFAIPAFEPISVPVAHVWIDITGDNVQDDAHNFYMAYKALNSSAGAAGGYFSTPTDCTKWMRTYLKGNLHSAEAMAAIKTFVTAPGSQGGQYGLGLMKNSFLGNLAYGHGGDLAYHASSWYFPEKDVSITVFTNDDQKNSWELLPVVSALLRSCQNYEEVSSTFDSHFDKSLVFKAFPNPFADELNFDMRCENCIGEIKYELRDAFGRCVASASTNQPNFKFDGLTALPHGTYFATATIEGTRPISRIVFK